MLLYDHRVNFKMTSMRQVELYVAAYCLGRHNIRAYMREETLSKGNLSDILKVYMPAVQILLHRVGPSCMMRGDAMVPATTFPGTQQVFLQVFKNITLAATVTTAQGF